MGSHQSPSKTAHILSDNVQPGVAPPSFTIQVSPLRSLRPYLLPALLILLTITAYMQVFSCSFIEAYDDEEFVTHNVVVLKGVTIYGLRWAFSSFMTGNWHPLTWLSHMIDVTLFGLNPAGHHLSSLALHILNTILLYYLLLRSTRFYGRSFLVAALFAIHPLHVESVAWISERKDLLSTAFGLVALHLYVQYVRTHKKTLYLAMFTFFCLSLMSKPMLVTFPFLLLVLDNWPLGRTSEQSFKSLLREKIPLFIPALVISVVTLMAQKSVGAMADRALFSRIYSAFDAYVIYLRKIFIPNDLTSFYPYVPVSSIRALLAVLFLGAITFFVWRYRQRAPWLLTGWLWFTGLLVPVIGIISVGAHAYADRYTYLPAIGVFIMAVWSSAEYFEKTEFKPWIATMTATVVVIACSLATWNQVGFWKDGFTLYSRELAVVKDNWHAHLNLGTMLVERKRYDEGIEHYREAQLNHPASEADVLHNLGVAFERKGSNDIAMAYFRSTIRLAPHRDKGYLGLARILGKTGDLGAALGTIDEGLRNVPDYGLLLAKEAYLLHLMGNVDDAVKSYRQAIAKDPDLVQNYINLGILLAKQGNKSDFDELVRQLRRIDPKAADNLAMSNN